MDLSYTTFPSIKLTFDFVLINHQRLKISLLVLKFARGTLQTKVMTVLVFLK